MSTHGSRHRQEQSLRSEKHRGEELVEPGTNVQPI